MKSRFAVVRHWGPSRVEPAPQRGQLVLFAPPKRPRGRPRKPARATPSSADFAQTAAAIVCLASGRDWLRCKEMVRSASRIDKRLNPAAREILSYLLDVINREHGYDWRTLESVAAECALYLKTVKRSYKRLAAVGLILREVRIINANGRGNKQGRTTIPALVDAALDVAKERARKEASKKPAMVGSENSDGGVRKIPMEGSANSDGRGQLNPMVGVNKTPLILQSTQDGEKPTEKAPGLVAGAGDWLIPFHGTDAATLAGVSDDTKGFQRVGCSDPLSLAKRHPFAKSLLRKISSEGIDAEKLVERYYAKTRGQDIENPTAYLLAMAKEEAAKRDGVTTEEIAALSTRFATRRQNIANNPLNPEVMRAKNAAAKPSSSLRASISRMR